MSRPSVTVLRHNAILYQRIGRLAHRAEWLRFLEGLEATLAPLGISCLEIDASKGLDKEFRFFSPGQLSGRPVPVKWQTGWPWFDTDNVAYAVEELVERHDDTDMIRSGSQDSFHTECHYFVTVTGLEAWVQRQLDRIEAEASGLFRNPHAKETL